MFGAKIPTGKVFVDILSPFEFSLYLKTISSGRRGSIYISLFFLNELAADTPNAANSGSSRINGSMVCLR